MNTALSLSSANHSRACWPSTATHPWCPFSGAPRLRASSQSHPVAQLPFRRLYFDLTLVFYAPGEASPVQRCASLPQLMRLPCVVDTTISWWVCPEVPSICCCHLLSKLGISHQSTGGSTEAFNRKLREKRPIRLTEADTVLWS